MKQFTGLLTGTLYDYNVYRIAECYTFAGGGFQPGGTQHWTTYSSNVTSGLVTWVTGTVITKGSVRAAAGTEVSTMELTIAPGTAQLLGVSMSLAAVQGYFDNVHVTFQRVFMDVTGTVAGIETEFDGIITEVRPGASQFGLTVSSQLARFNKPFPYRVVQPSCNWNLYSTECGVVWAANLQNFTIAAGTTTSDIKINSVSSYLAVGSLITFTGGANQTSRVAAQVISQTEFKVYPPLAKVPAVGDPINISRSCDKNRRTCHNTFNNVTRFGGFADVPPPKK